MNVIVFTTWAIQNFMPAIHGELIKKYLDRGDKVKVVVCNSELHSCGIPHFFMENLHTPPFKEKELCLDCQTKWVNILKDDLQVDKGDIVKMTPFPKDGFVPTFTTREDVENCMYEGINIGVGILSSIITITRDLDVDIVKYRPALEAIYKNSVASILTMQNLSSSFSPDYVSIYNGRMAERRAVVNYCKGQNLPFHTWEIAQSEEHFYTVENSLPHDPKIFAQDANYLFFEDSSKSQEEKKNESEQWYKKKRLGNYDNQTNDINYTIYMKDTNIDSLDIDKTKTNIAIFISSEDEIASLGNDIWPFKYRQTESIQAILEHFKDNLDFHFYLRVHPNLRSIDNEDTRNLHALAAPNLTVIPAKSPLNSYALLDACDKVVSFASTMGVEATYWKKPSISFGTSFYKYIKDIVFFAEDFEELFKFIKDKNLEPKPQEGALIYSYALNNRGSLLSPLSREIYNKRVDRSQDNNLLLAFSYKLYKRFPFFEKIISGLHINRFAKRVLLMWHKTKMS